MRIKNRFLLLAVSTLMLLAACDLFGFGATEQQAGTDQAEAAGAMSYVVNGNKPSFDEEEYAMAASGTFQSLSELDELGRVGVALGCYDYYGMPTYDRESLSTNPTGWKQAKYDTSIVDGGWLYNRSHLIGFQISGLQDEPRNLMTGTRAFNAGEDGSMLTYENIVAGHLRTNKSHDVLYRVSPDFHGDNLLAHGVLMEADCLQCDEIDYCVYVRNQQPGIVIDYATGDNYLSGTIPDKVEDETEAVEGIYILNTNSMKFHYPSCSSAPKETSQNYAVSDMTREELIEAGFSPCGVCKP